MEILAIIIAFLAAASLILLTAALIEPHLPEVSRTTIHTGCEGEIDILYFSDLHAEYCFIPPERIIEQIRENKPDIVIFGGDICNNPKNINCGIKYLSEIADECLKNNIPFIGTTGNHDVEIPIEDVAACGFTNISSDIYEFTDRNGHSIIFSGLYDSGRENRIWQEIPCPDKTDKADLHITLSHNPDQVLHLTTHLPDIMLSGHIHGGQVRTPFGIEFKLIRKDELPKMHIIHGLYSLNGMQCFISRGIGCVRLPIRLGARPEINLIEVRT